MGLPCACGLIGQIVECIVRFRTGWNRMHGGFLSDSRIRAREFLEMCHARERLADGTSSYL